MLRPRPSVGKALPSGLVQSKGKAGPPPKPTLVEVRDQPYSEELTGEEEIQALGVACSQSLVTHAQESSLQQFKGQYRVEITEVKSVLQSIQETMKILLEHQTAAAAAPVS